jgi:hypothetical protein
MATSQAATFLLFDCGKLNRALTRFVNSEV